MSRVTAVERAHRILTILPWIMANPGCEVSDVAERFAVTEESLRQDLDVVFNRVEVYPFTPDMLIDVVIDEDQIFVSLGDYFDHPPGLNESEALMLLTAGQLAMRLGGHTGSIGDGGILTSALTKLAASLSGGSDGDGGGVAVEISEADPDTTDRIRAAIDTHRQLRIEYYSFGRDELTVRTIDPWRLTNHSGYWYLRAFCHRAGGEREFRLDRIYSVEETGEHFDPAADGSDEVATRGVSGRLVTLRGPRSIDWVARTYPIESSRTGDDGTVEIDLIAAHDQWLERLLLRLPAGTTAVDAGTGAGLDELRNDAARRILDRYGIT